MYNPRNWPPSGRDPQKQVASAEKLTPDDIEAELENSAPELFQYFKRLPKELWARHFYALEDIEQSDNDSETRAKQKLSYMQIVAEGRENAIVDYEISDEELRKHWYENGGTKERLLEMVRGAFSGKDNYLGSGMTARVKSMILDGVDDSIAVKYLLTPTEKTLSASGEHDMLKELETVLKVEEVEHRAGIGKGIRVPHPYFHFKRGKFQCYGMHEVNGVTFDAVIDGRSEDIGLQDKILEAIRTRYASKEAQDELLAEVRAFADAMHEICLHGDIKGANIMVDTNGVIYLIDFGQSIPARSEHEKTRDQFSNLRDKEKEDLQTLVRALFLRAFAAI